jgi:phenylacetate-CoA ligase
MNKFYDKTWTDMSGIPFPLDWYRKIFNLHHYTMSEKALDYWDDYRETQFWSKKKWQEYNDKKVVDVVRYAYQNVPFYKALYDRHNIDIEQIKTAKDLEKLPLIDKTTLSMGIGELTPSKIVKDDKTLWIKTSGSTGVRMSFTCDQEQLDRRWAVWMRLFEWTGWRWGNKELRFWFKFASTIKQPKLEGFDAFLSNRNFLEFNELNDSELQEICDKIISSEPYLVTGYWEAIETIAKYAYQNGIKLNSSAVIPSTQVVTDGGRKMVESVFKTLVYDKYASAEVSGIGHQCEQTNLYHIQAENLYLEILKDGRPIKEGLGEAIITDFSNRSTPLIRYRVGDVLEATQEECPCKKTLPVFKRPHGRLKNIINIKGKLLTELQIAELEFSLWKNKIADRIKLTQKNENEIVALASNIQDSSKLKTKLEKFTGLKDITIIPVDTINHFRGKRHRGETKLVNPFNN